MYIHWGLYKFDFPSGRTIGSQDFDGEYSTEHRCNLAGEVQERNTCKKNPKVILAFFCINKKTR